MNRDASMWKNAAVAFAVVGAGILLLMSIGSAARAASPEPPHDATTANTRDALACTSDSNCVDTVGSGSMEPLHFDGTPAEALARLRATLADFHGAKIVKEEGSSVETIFTTFLGFRDAVDFRVDAENKRIDFRSRSLVGQYDFGKNRSRMADFTGRFKQHLKR